MLQPPAPDAFNRFHTAKELKFLVPAETAAAILSWSRTQLAPDPHGLGSFGDEYHTSTLYFDTTALDVYHRRGSFRRSKYRIRRYGHAPLVFLERKLRTPRMLTKRRTAIHVDALREHLQGAPVAGWNGDWFRQRLEVRQLGPSCQVGYRRVARVGTTESGPIRLTFDHDITARQAAGLLFSQDAGVRVLEEHVVVEVKYRRELPVLFRRLAETFGLEPGPASKYRLSVEALGHDDREHPIHVARRHA